ncbi:NAD-dependent epimerase/dehydratase family protein [Flaviflagellibacter deserti]|uniref:NAD-dependent epimerase/dehydratase family protein n=1 Tax=Flaviflagellibacter deserti TaxID=2267266 RepID=A0ABV9Z2R6_9HYPH
MTGPVLITGGAGFVGCNLADSFLGDGHDVIVFDALSRQGVETNLAWLRKKHGARVRAVIADIRDATAVDEAVLDASAVIHLAAQVAVTSSLEAPLEDFSINGQGTLNVLEALRRKRGETPLLFASTNKVYGHLGQTALTSADDRYEPLDHNVRQFGISEAQPLDFATPYGCSKGVADQYVVDYSRTFDLKTAVLRMSCIYGPRQFGTEDQGWVAHFLIRALSGEPITIYGDGRQVRDVLHVSDAVQAYRSVLNAIDRCSGRAFNLGGGPSNAVSLRILLKEIRALLGREVMATYADWRPGDQLYFVADTRRLTRELGWSATIGWRQGLRDLASWIEDHGEVIRKANRPAPARLIA